MAITRSKDANRGSEVPLDSKSSSSKTSPTSMNKSMDLQSSDTMDTSNKTSYLKLLLGSYQDQIKILNDKLREKNEMIFNLLQIIASKPNINFSNCCSVSRIPDR